MLSVAGCASTRTPVLIEAPRPMAGAASSLELQLRGMLTTQLGRRHDFELVSTDPARRAPGIAPRYLCATNVFVVRGDSLAAMIRVVDVRTGVVVLAERQIIAQDSMTAGYVVLIDRTIRHLVDVRSGKSIASSHSAVNAH